MVLQDLLLVAVGHLVVDGSHVYRLARPVDGTVGEQLCLLHLTVALVVAVGAVFIGRRTGVVRPREGINLRWAPVAIFISGLALGISRQRSHQPIAAAIEPAIQLDGGSADGLALGSIDHDIAYLVLGQGNHHHPDVADIVELTVSLGLGVAPQLEHIDADGQSWHLNGVLEHVVGFLPRVVVRHLQLRQLCQQRLQFLVVFVVVGVELVVVLDLHPEDVHRQLVNVAGAGDSQLLRLVGQSYALLQ